MIRTSSGTFHAPRTPAAQPSAANTARMITWLAVHEAPSTMMASLAVIETFDESSHEGCDERSHHDRQDRMFLHEAVQVPLIGGVPCGRPTNSLWSVASSLALIHVAGS